MIVCPKCRSENHGSANFCESCGKSLAAEQEADDAIQNMLLGEARKGAIALGIVALVQLVVVAMLGSNWVLWTIVGIFAGLAVWALYVPLIACSVGLGVFVLLHVLEAVADPASIGRGIIMKVVIISLLVGGIRNGLKHREFMKERGKA